jgi:hypothetical protein
VNTRQLSIRNKISVTAKGRGLCISTKGRVGWDLLSTREVDEVWILEGCLVPCLLRPTAKGRYLLLGEAYVHGIMYGEALKVWISTNLTRSLLSSLETPVYFISLIRAFELSGTHSVGLSRCFCRRSKSLNGKSEIGQML